MGARMPECPALTEADRLFDRKDYDQALKLYRKALSDNPLDVEARTGIALSLVYTGRYAEAVPYLQELSGHLPDSEELGIILSEVLYKSGRTSEAEERLLALIAAAPANVDAHVRLGRLHLDSGNYPKANRYLAVALDLNPLHVEALAYMGMMMIKFCQFEDALRALHRALTIEPQNVLVLNNLGRAYKMMGRLEEAVTCYRQALEIEPDNLPVAGNYLFALNYCVGLDPEYIAGEHFRLAPLYVPRNPMQPPLFTRKTGGELPRIGYISGDFYTHSVSYFIEPVLQNHDYSQFEVYCYSLGMTKDATTERLKTLPCIWREMTAVQPEMLAKQVREDRIDILVDLSGHTADNRLGVFAARSAPVQVSWIGYPNTTGLRQMDYYITDAACDPPGKPDRLFSEKLYRLPQVFSCYLPPLEFPAITPCPCLDNGCITFGSFNNFAKVNDELIRLWSCMLLRTPDSRLYLKSMSLGDEVTKASIRKSFELQGVDPSRISMRTVTMTPFEHMQEYSKVDIALDTFPYNGTTTTCEALWNGVPVVTLAGETHVSRVGLSFLSSIGLHDLVAISSDGYVDNAVRLAGDRMRLAALRNDLRMLMAVSPLMDAAGVTRSLEKGFSEMLQKYWQEVS